MAKIRLVVVDDHGLFRAGLVSLLSEMKDFEVVGEAGDGNTSLQVIARENPDVILLDVNMPDMSGVDVVKKLREQDKVKILMLTISKNDQDLIGAISAGADGYLLKNADPSELEKAIHLIHQGFSVLSPQVTKQVLRSVAIERNDEPENELSTREMEVLDCLSRGQTTIQIAEELFISDNTVKTHVRHILEKLDASNRAEAVSKAIQFGLLGKEK
jgi:DNA-binding NarL/FixJ family response regulator